MSISATLVGAVVLLLRRLPRLPRRAACFLWLFPFLRLSIPISLGTRYSIMSLMSQFFGRFVSVPVSSGELSGMYAMNYIVLAERYTPFTYKTMLIERVFFISSVIWLTVAVAWLLLILYCYISEARHARSATRLYDNVYAASGISSPVLVGIVRPRILIPESMSQKVNELIILHENAHARSLDNLWRILAVCVAVLHWFNPFVWIFLRLFLSDIEYACDERVLARIGESRRREYARVLVDCAEIRLGLASPFFGGSLSARIRRILNYRRLTAMSLVCVLIFIAAVAFVLMTNSV